MALCLISQIEINGSISLGSLTTMMLRASSVRIRMARLRMRMRISVLGFASNRNREPNNSASNSPTFTTRYSYLTNKCITIKQKKYEQQNNRERHCKSHFKGGKPESLEVETFAKIDGREVAFVLLSPGAQATIEELRDKAIDEQLEAIKQIAPEIAIIEV